MQRAQREQKIRRLVDVYGDHEVLPADLQVSAAKLRADIVVLRNLETLVKAKRMRESRRRDLFDQTLTSWQKKRSKLEITYHAGLGFQTVIAYLADYRATRLSCERTESEIKRFNADLSKLMQGIADLNLPQLIETSVDDQHPSSTQSVGNYSVKR